MLACALVQASTAFAGVLQVADAEQSWNKQWASWSCADASRVQEVSSPVAQGSKAYELTVHDGDNAYGRRCELGDGNPGRSGFPVFHAGDERWISFQVYLPDSYPIDTPNWNVMFQIHQAGDGGCPPISLNVENGQFKLYNSARPSYVLDTTEKWHGPATRNRWVKFTLHILNSPDDNTGYVELYGDLDGQGMKQLMDRTYMHTMTALPGGGAMENHARIGIYRNPAIQGTASIYFDGFTIATDRSSAESVAFGNGSQSGQNQGGQDQAPANGNNGNDGSGSLPANPLPLPAARKHVRRVVLRSRRRSASVARAAGWPRVLPVYGWVKTHGHRLGRRSVVIEILHNGRWEWLSRGWLRSNGHFYLAPAVDVTAAHRVKLRAHVIGVGYSRAVTAQV